MRRLLAFTSLFLLAPPSLALADEVKDASAPRVASGKEVDAYLQELARRTEGMKSLRVRFRQEKKLRLLRRPRVSTSELVFAGGKIAVTTKGRTGDVESRLLLEKGELKIFYPALARMEIFPSSGDPTKRGAAAGRPMSLPLFTGDWKTMKKLYTIVMRVTETDDSKPPVVDLELTPKDVKAAVRKVTLSLVDHRIREYVQEERNGNRVRMEVLEWTKNVKVSPATFEMRVPANTKIVRVVPQK